MPWLVLFFGLFFSTSIANGNNEIVKIIMSFVDFCKNIIIVTIGQKNIIFIIGMEILTIIFIVYYSLKYNKKLGIIMFLGNLFFVYVQTCVFSIQISPRTAIIPTLVLLFDWNVNETIKQDNKIDYLEIIVVIFCLMSIPNMINLIKDEIQYPYSDSKNASSFIEENIPENSTIVTIHWNTISPIEVYLSGKDYKFFDATSLEYMTYATWNRFLDVEVDNYIEDAIEYLKENGENNIYFLEPISDSIDITYYASYNKIKDKLRLLYVSPTRCISRKTYIYKIEY